MAVQAQYPSNILHVNRRGQEGHEFSLQQQEQAAGGVFINNPRKRGREVAATPPINSFSLQTQRQAQTPQLIDLSQLHQSNLVSTGLRLSSGDQQKNLQQSQNHNYPQQKQSSLISNSSAFFSMVSDHLGTQIKRHREELDQFLQAQGEELRCVLVEKTQRQFRALLVAAEESVARRLRDKEAGVEKSKRRNSELEARAAQLSVEAQVWQAKAKAQEATATSLQAQLQRAIVSGGAAMVHDCRRGDEGLNCAGEVEGQAEDAESAYVDPDRMVAMGPSCKACRTRVASVVLLPCRHLCLCTECDSVAQACPLCLTVWNSSIEVSFFSLKVLFFLR